jgi:hypothetical protein
MSVDHQPISLCQDDRNQREACGCEESCDRGGAGAVLVFGDHAAAPCVRFISYKPCACTIATRREHPRLPRKGGPPVELALVILVVTAFAALVVPSLVGVLIDPKRFKERPTPPSLAPPTDRGRLRLPGWVITPRLRKGRPSQPQHQPPAYNSVQSAPSLHFARRRDPRASGDLQPSADNPGGVASLPVRRK